MIENMTGLEPECDSTPEEVGLASVGLPVMAGMLNSAFSNGSSPISITARELVHAKTMDDIVDVIENVLARIDE